MERGKSILGPGGSEGSQADRVIRGGGASSGETILPDVGSDSSSDVSHKRENPVPPRPWRPLPNPQNPM